MEVSQRRGKATAEPLLESLFRKLASSVPSITNNACQRCARAGEVRVGDTQPIAQNSGQALSVEGLMRTVLLTEPRPHGFITAFAAAAHQPEGEQRLLGFEHGKRLDIRSSMLHGLSWLAGGIIKPGLLVQCARHVG